jgi:hypothetical protein
MQWHLQNMGRPQGISKLPPPPDHTDIIANPDGTYSVAGTPILRLAIVINPSWSKTDPHGKIKRWVDEMSSYYANSGAAIDFEVACVKFDEDMPNWSSQALNHIKTYYRTLSKNNKADLVAGLIGGQYGDPYCGIATLGTPNYYAPMASVSRCNSKTFAHEIGHNLGLHHAHQKGYEGRKGYCMAPLANARDCWRGTMMSYAGSGRVPFFANKHHTYQGDPLGNDEHDAVEYLNAQKVGKALAWELYYERAVGRALSRTQLETIYD